MRETSGLEKKIVAVLNEPTEVWFTGYLYDADGYKWAGVTYNRESGWIATNYLTLAPQSSKPTIPKPSTPVVDPNDAIITAAWPSTKDEKAGVALAKYLLDAVFADDINENLTTSIDKKVVAKGSLLAYTYAGEYYERLQCTQNLINIVSGLATVADYGEFMFTTYHEQIQMTGHPLAAAGATGVLTIEKGVLDIATGGSVIEPSLVGGLEHAINSALTKEELAAVQNFDRMNMSIMRYIIYDDDWNILSASKLRTLAVTRAKACKDFLQTATVTNGHGGNNETIRANAQKYLDNVISWNQASSQERKRLADAMIN